MTVTDRIQRGAAFSKCRNYRYMLTRTWDDCGDGTYLNIIGLNPSTADHLVDDPTIRRCIGFARLWGFGGLTMTNLFAFRATDPAALRSTVDPIGPENDLNLLEQARWSRMVVAAWGVHGALNGRAEQVLRLLDGVDLHCLGTTKEGHPKHPLYLASVTLPQPFPAAANGGPG